MWYQVPAGESSEKWVTGAVLWNCWTLALLSLRDVENTAILHILGTVAPWGVGTL
jgi:hypothetical protein